MISPIASFVAASLFFFNASVSAIAQNDIPFAKDIEKNIFKATFTYIVPNDEGAPLLFSYERQLYKPITLVAGAGTSFIASINDEAELEIHSFASIELRYYFNLMHRLKKDKYVRNFSAPYLAVQESLFSGPIALIRISSANALTGQARTFLNIGWQRQFKQRYLHLFLGPGLHFNDLDKGEWIMIDDFHVGIGFGFVLFE
jgi:hypothetical protein